MQKQKLATGRRPKKRARRSAAISKERIIKTAIEEFSAKGFDGARVDEVSRRSGVNKTLIYHYIGNKDRLFTAALEATYRTIRKRQRDFMAGRLPPGEGVRQLAQLLMSIWVEHQEFGRLLATENFLGGTHIRKSKAIRQMYNPLVDALNTLMERGVQQGIFRDGIDPIDLYISMSALSAYYVSHNHTLDALFHTDLLSPRRLRQREMHIVDMILRYVCRNLGQARSRTTAGASRPALGSALVTPRSSRPRQPQINRPVAEAPVAQGRRLPLSRPSVGQGRRRSPPPQGRST
jgi:TetR/AcrR family transcriptional regulator